MSLKKLLTKNKLNIDQIRKPADRNMSNQSNVNLIIYAKTNYVNIIVQTVKVVFTSFFNNNLIVRVEKLSLGRLFLEFKIKSKKKHGK